HDILCTRFQTLPGMKLPVQVILTERAPDWSEADLSALSPAEREEQIEICLRPSGASPAELAAGAGLGARLLRLAPDRHALVLTLSALCADARTFANLWRELTPEDACAAGAIPFEIDAARLVDLRAAAEAHGVSLPTFLLAAWQMLLWRLTGERVEIGVTKDGREFEELGDACGPFTRVLPARG